MEPVATFVKQLDSLGILEPLATHERSTFDVRTAEAVARLRTTLILLKKYVRSGHPLVSESMFVVFLDPFKKSRHSETLREYVFPVLFYLGSLPDTNGYPPVVEALLKAPWENSPLLPMYTQFALVLAKAEMLNTGADGTRGFTWEWRGEQLCLKLVKDETEKPYRWVAPQVSTVAEALAAVKELLKAIRAVLGLEDAPARMVITAGHGGEVLTTPAYQEGEAAFESLKTLALEAFREGTRGGIAGYYRNRFSDNAIGLDGPDDERLYTTDSFDVIIVDGRPHTGPGWKYIFQPKTRQGMFCVMPASQ